MAEFINHTPFDALCYSGYDVKRQEYDIVVCCAEYVLSGAEENNQFNTTAHRQGYLIERFYNPIVNDIDPISLSLVDDFYGETLLTSVLIESDLSPYKPKCDIIIQGYAYHKSLTDHFDASLSLCQLKEGMLQPIMHKSATLYSQRDWVLSNDKAYINLSDFYHYYKPQTAKLTNKIALRYENSLGGTQVIHYNNKVVFSEACYKNPIGTGWLCWDYFERLKQYEQSIPRSIAMPQILPEGISPFEPLITKQSGALTAQELSVLSYPNAGHGFGFIHRSWSPRIAKAGTYDENWLNNTHPFYPEDFDFNYYNSAPEDQQIDFPDLQIPHYLLINNLTPNAGFEAIAFPRHRAFVLISMFGIRVPMPMQVDTIIFDNEKMTLKFVWRTAILKSFEPNEIQLRFEINPEAPLIKL